MAHWLIMVGFMVVIGAAIGGLTNFLAIRMLFRPYKTLYIGKWRVPFTPGLIPKRQGELAAQVGKLVVDYLVTPDSIYKKLTDEAFKKETEKWVQEKAAGWLDREITPLDLLTRFGVENAAERSRALIDGAIEKKYAALKAEYLGKTVGEVLPSDLKVSMKEQIPALADCILAKASDFFESYEGKDKIRFMLENFLESRGRLVNMLQAMIGSDQLVDRAQLEILKFLRNEGTKEMVVSVLTAEADKLEDKKLSVFYEKLDEEQILQYMKKAASGLLPIEKVLGKSIQELLVPYRETLIMTALPKLLGSTGAYLSSRSGEILSRFGIEEMIRKEVESFSLKRLEKIVISIAKKELTMITYLGALLGGLIGLIQGIIVLSLS